MPQKVERHSPARLLEIDRHIEGAHQAVRFKGNRLQTYQLEGDLVTAWCDLSLSGTKVQSVWASLGIDRLTKLEARPGPPEGPGPEVLQEQDETVMVVQDGDLRREVSCGAGKPCPVALEEAVQRLRELCKTEGRTPRGLATALLAEDLDKPNRPAETSIAEALARGGVTFRGASDLADVPPAAAAEAMASPGWLAAAGGPRGAGDAPALFYVETQGRHFRLRKLRIHLAQ